jgi:hypothetical protein
MWKHLRSMRDLLARTDGADSGLASSMAHQPIAITNCKVNGDGPSLSGHWQMKYSAPEPLQRRRREASIRLRVCILDSRRIE